MTSAVVTAYDAAGAGWQDGPGRIYDRLSDVLAECSPVPLRGALVLDLGAGTGAATRAARRRGANVVAVDVAVGMLAADAPRRPPAAVGDVLALPFASGVFDAAIAAFSLNHLADPVAGLREARRVLRSAGGLVAAAYAADDSHPVKAATDEAASERGWAPEAWYEALRRQAIPRLATVERAAAVAAEAGLAGAVVEHVRVPFPDVDASGLVAWRLGMAQMAPFVARLPAAERIALATDALRRLGPNPPPLVRSVVVLTWRAPA